MAGTIPKPQGPRNSIAEASSLPIPLDLAEARPYVSETGVEFIDGSFETPKDFDIASYLAWRAMLYFAGPIADPDQDVEYEIPVKVLKEFIEPGSKHTSTDTVKRAVANLRSTAVNLTWIRNGQQLESVCNLANFSYTLDKWRFTMDGMVRYRFPEPVRWLVSHMGRDVLWTRIEMSVSNRFATTHEARLYEFLCRYVHRRCKETEEMPLGQLHDLLVIGADSSYRKDWFNLRVRVIDRVKEILDEHGAFTFGYTEVRRGRGGGGGKVHAVKFMVERKDGTERLAVSDGRDVRQMNEAASVFMG